MMGNPDGHLRDGFSIPTLDPRCPRALEVISVSLCLFVGTGKYPKAASE